MSYVVRSGWYLRTQNVVPGTEQAQGSQAAVEGPEAMEALIAGLGGSP